MTTLVPPPHQAPSEASLASSSPNQTIYTPASDDPSPRQSRFSSRQPSPCGSKRSMTSPSPSLQPTQPNTAPFHQVRAKGDFAHNPDLDRELEEDEDMPERPAMHRPTDGQSQLPLLKDERGRPSYDSPHGSARPTIVARRSTFQSRSPESEALSETKRKYTYAALCLVLSLVSFVVQTETAVYIQKEMEWDKAYCMLYLTHGSWSLLWPAMLLGLRIKNWNKPWRAFWRRHIYILRTTAQMVQSHNFHLTSRDAQKSPVSYILRTIPIVTIALTIAGCSWYVAVKYTTPSDLTAIYNCSAFFAYAFSIPLLNDKLRADKIISVAVATGGVMIVAYGDSGATNKGDISGGAAADGRTDAQYRVIGNIIIGVGSVLFGLYEVLYKRLACPPEGTSPGRGVMFAITIASLIGSFTVLVLWIPLPILHVTGAERFRLPEGRAAWLLLISIMANAIFSGSFLTLISLTSPVLSSVAALLTIFLVAIVDWYLNGEPLSMAAIIGGLLIMAAFLLLSWSTYREMDEERRKRLEIVVVDSDSES